MPYFNIYRIILPSIRAFSFTSPTMVLEMYTILKYGMNALMTLLVIDYALFMPYNAL